MHYEFDLVINTRHVKIGFESDCETCGKVDNQHIARSVKGAIGSISVHVVSLPVTGESTVDKSTNIKKSEWEIIAQENRELLWVRRGGVKDLETRITIRKAIACPQKEIDALIKEREKYIQLGHLHDALETVDLFEKNYHGHNIQFNFLPEN